MKRPRDGKLFIFWLIGRGNDDLLTTSQFENKTFALID